MQDCRIHIFGASGSGTTSLGRAVAKRLQIPFLDTDDFFWKATDPPFVQSIDRDKRASRLREATDKERSWVLSGSLCGWGDFLIPRFTLVVFLHLPQEIRMQRLREREVLRYDQRINPDGDMYQQSNEFLNWAKQYDNADTNIRSLQLHELWMKSLTCPVLKLMSDVSLTELEDQVLEKLS